MDCGRPTIQARSINSKSKIKKFFPYFIKPQCGMMPEDKKLVYVPVVVAYGEACGNKTL
jgi:hypothetical protein